MVHGYTRSVTFHARRFRMILRVWKNETWRIGVTFADAEEVQILEAQGFDDPMSAVNSLDAYVDELIDGARLITRIRVQRAIEKLTRDVLKGEAQ